MKKKGAIDISMKYIIPIILGILVIVFYLLFFGPNKIIGMLNQSLGTTP